MTLESGYSNDYEAYVRPIENDSPWSCVLCRIREDRLVVDEIHCITHQWIRYGLACNHEAHETCYRAWTIKMNCVGCPSCGPLHMTDAPPFCSTCHQFHSDSCKKDTNQCPQD